MQGHGVVASVVVMVLVSASPSREAFADPAGAHEAVVAPEQQTWNLGVEVALGAWSGNVGPVGVAALGNTTATGVSAERRLAGPLWLRARGGVYIERSTTDAYTYNNAGGYGGLGLRSELASAGPLLVSVFAEAQINGGRARWKGEEVDSRTASLGVAGVGGLAGEVELTPVVGLRAEVSLLRAGWQRVSYSDEVTEGTHVGLDVVPSVQLRLRL